MQLGKGINESSAERLASEVAPNLLEGEAILLLCKCNNFKPLVDRVALTNLRLLALSDTGGKIGYDAARGAVVEVVAESRWSGATLAITTADGTTRVLKGMEPGDAEAIRDLFHSVDPTPTPAPTTDGDAAGQLAEDGPEAEPTRKPGAWAKVGATVRKAYDETANMVKDEFTAPPVPGYDAEVHGALLEKATVGSRKLELYENGFIRAVSEWGGTPQFERLVSVKYRESTNTFTRDQSALGSFLVTGLSLGMASNENVETKTHASITIATEKNVYTGDIKPNYGRAIEALADGILARRQEQSSPASPAPTATPDIADQIKKLAELHSAGILTDEEFAAKKAELLDRM